MKNAAIPRESQLIRSLIWSDVCQQDLLSDRERELETTYGLVLASLFGIHDPNFRKAFLFSYGQLLLEYRPARGKPDMSCEDRTSYIYRAMQQKAAAIQAKGDFPLGDYQYPPERSDGHAAPSDFDDQNPTWG